MSNSDVLYTERDTATLLGISVRALKGHVHTNPALRPQKRILPLNPVALGAGVRCYRREEVEALAEKRRKRKSQKRANEALVESVAGS